MAVKPFELGTGVFRANPDIAYDNVMKVPADDLGTEGTDTVAVDVETPPSEWTGINYEGADGVENFYRFFDVEYPTAKKIYKNIPYSQTDTDTLVEEILKIIALHEIDSVVTATFAAGSPDTMTIVHKGSGTLAGVLADGVETAGSRA